MSDWGSYSYWWHPSGWNWTNDFRVFLLNCGFDYIESKLAGGKTEVDEESTVDHIKDAICRQRRENRDDFGRDAAREEWDLVESSDFTHETGCSDWYRQTQLYNASEMICHRRPIQLQMFLKHCWPMLRVEIARDIGAPLRKTAHGWFRRFEICHRCHLPHWDGEDFFADAGCWRTDNVLCRTRTRPADAASAIEAARRLRGPHVSGVGLVRDQEQFDRAIDKLLG